MKIILKNYYAAELTIVVEPSERDIEFIFFNEIKKYQAFLPIRFNRGKRFEVNFHCMSCNEEIGIKNILLTHKIENSFIDIGFMSTLYHSRFFIDTISSFFSKLSRKDREHFFGYSMRLGGVSRILYQKCPHCEAQYLATYYDIQGQYPERTTLATPDEFYIEEMAWVEFDEAEFFEEMQKK